MVETKEFSELKPGSFLSLLNICFQFPLQGDGQTGVIAVGLEGSEKDQAVSWAGDGHAGWCAQSLACLALHPAASSSSERLALIRLQAAD